MLVKLLTDFYSDDDITTAKAVLYDTAFCSRDTPRLIKRKGKDKNISNVQDIVNIFLEMPPSSFPSYVAKDLSRLPPLSMNCFDIASLVKDIESLKIHTSILQESYESVVKAQLLACQNTQWRSQGGARGAMAPPKLLVNVFFLQLISGNLEVTRKCPNKFPELR